MSDEEIEGLRRQAANLQIVYVVLFLASLVILVLQWTTIGFGAFTTIIWAATLGSAVLVRIYRSSLVQKLNAALLERSVNPVDDA